MRTQRLHHSIGILTLLFCLICISFPIFASADTKVYDYANLFSLEQLELLESAASNASKTYQMDIGIVTTDDTNGMSSMEYADSFYDNNGYGYGTANDGLLFLIDMDNRQIYISTCGSGLLYFSDERINKILDSAYNYVSNEDYYGSANNFIDNVTYYINRGIPNNQYSVKDDFVSAERKPFTTSAGEPLNASSITLSVIVALLGATFIAFIVRMIVKRTYTHPKYTMPQTKPDDLSVHYTEREDRFVTSHTTKVKIQDNNGGGSGGGSGRSSYHSSSSGRSHGGGGRSF